MKLLTAVILTLIFMTSCAPLEAGRINVTHAHTVTDKAMLNELPTIVVDNLFNLTLSQEMYESVSIDDRCMFTYVKESMLALEYVTEMDCDIPEGGYENPISRK